MLSVEAAFEASAFGMLHKWRNCRISVSIAYISHITKDHGERMLQYHICTQDMKINIHLEHCLVGTLGTSHFAHLCVCLLLYAHTELNSLQHRIISEANTRIDLAQNNWSLLSSSRRSQHGDSSRIPSIPTLVS